MNADSVRVNLTWDDGSKGYLIISNRGRGVPHESLTRANVHATFPDGGYEIDSIEPTRWAGAP